jgi:hypothetical protein
MESPQQRFAFQSAKIEKELVTEKRTDKGCQYNPTQMQVSLERQKTGHDQDCFPLQKCAGKQHPVSMNFEVISEKLLNLHNLLRSGG